MSELHEETMEDFVQRFHHTYIKIVCPEVGINEPALAFIRDCKPQATGSYSVAFSAAIAEGIRISMVKGMSLVQALPTSKYVNRMVNAYTKEHSTAVATFYSRLPDRQYKRGCCENNFTSYTSAFAQNELAMLARKAGCVLNSHKSYSGWCASVADGSSLWAFDTIEKLFDPDYPDFVTALKMMLNYECLSMAFSHYYCFVYSVLTNDIQLCRKNVPIAIVSLDDVPIIKPTENLFRQEIFDLIRREVIPFNTLVV